MKIIKILVGLVLIVNLSIYSQGITIGSGTIIYGGSATISVSGNWNNSGTFTPGFSTVILNGSSNNQTITNIGGDTFNNLVVNKTTDDVQLLSNITVNGNLTVTSGDIDLNGNTITLGLSALLKETAGNTVKGTSGVITTTRSLNAPSNNNVAGLGAILTTSADLGSTIIERGHAVQTGEGNESILRYFDITPTTNSGLDATLKLCYDQSELNSIPESELDIYRSTDGGVSWTKRNGIVNTSANQIELSGIDEFSRWTAGGNSSPLPVELVAFEAQTENETVILGWETATEVNNYGFEIERASTPLSMNSTSGTASTNNNFIPSGDEGWEMIGFVSGNGNSNSPKLYSFSDNPIGGSLFKYRLKQIDIDGKFTYSDIVELQVIPENYELCQNYPNPFNPTTTINFSLPKISKTKLVIFDLLGREVATLVNSELPVGLHTANFDASDISSGVYFYSLKTKDFSQIKRMLLVK